MVLRELQKQISTQKATGSGTKKTRKTKAKKWFPRRKKNDL